MQEKTAALYGEILMLTDQVCVCEKKLIIFFFREKILVKTQQQKDYLHELYILTEF